MGKTFKKWRINCWSSSTGATTQGQFYDVFISFSQKPLIDGVLVNVLASSSVYLEFVHQIGALYQKL
jgi:hypothetical protein